MHGEGVKDAHTHTIARNPRRHDNSAEQGGGPRCGISNGIPLLVISSNACSRSPHLTERWSLFCRRDLSSNDTRRWRLTGSHRDRMNYVSHSRAYTHSTCGACEEDKAQIHTNRLLSEPRIIINVWYVCVCVCVCVGGGENLGEKMCFPTADKNISESTVAS